MFQLIRIEKAKDKKTSCKSLEFNENKKELVQFAESLANERTGTKSFYPNGIMVKGPFCVTKYVIIEVPKLSRG